ncbi:MAG: hypothetical protein QOI96_1029 [Verrucomicrobiota bacterium]
MSVRFASLLITSLAFCGSIYAQDAGMPFGPIGDADVERLAEFAKKSGFDLKREIDQVYNKDEEALARLFRFSLSFKTLDRDARTYGQIVYSSLLNLGEMIGEEAYVKVLDRQSAEVQQRVRDYFYYPLLIVAKERRKEREEETRKNHPVLFPKTFQFGRGDPVFAKEAEQLK